MPEYRWVGINLGGKSQKGILFAAGPTQLKLMLLKKSIALTTFKEKQKKRFLFSYERKKYISPQNIASLFGHLSLLVESGITLHDALIVTQNYMPSTRIKKSIKAILEAVQRGFSLSQALEEQKNIYSSLMIHIVISGEQSGELAQALKLLASYITNKTTLIKKLRHAALLPTITLAFAILITFSILAFIAPQFEPLFASMKENIPLATQIILEISTTIQDPYNQIRIVSGLFILIITIKTILSCKKIIILKDKIILNIPLIASIVITTNLIQFLQTLLLLLKSGNPLQQSLVQASNVCTNHLFRKQLLQVANHVGKGSSLEEAFNLIDASHFPQALRTTMAIGEQSGKLEIMLKKTITVFQNKLETNIHLITTVFQPILLIVVGLLIALLLLALYIPLFNSASSPLPFT